MVCPYSVSAAFTGGAAAVFFAFFTATFDGTSDSSSESDSTTGALVFGMLKKEDNMLSTLKTKEKFVDKN